MPAVVSLSIGHCRTGERKTSCDNEAAWPIARHEANLRLKYDEDRPAYEDDKLIWEKLREKVVRQGKSPKGDRIAMKADLLALGPPPTAPLQPILTCDEPTYEGLCKLYIDSRPSLGIYSDDGGRFIGGHAMNDEAKLRTATGLSKLWDGTPIKRVRGGDGTQVLPGRRLSMHLMVQPTVVDRLYRDQLLTDQGLLTRILVTAPDSTAGGRLWHERDPESDPALKRYGARLLGILETRLPLAQGKFNELAPRQLEFTAEAANRWINFADHVEQRLARGGALEPVRGFGNKLAEHAARLAGVLRLVDDIDAGEIRDRDLDAGIMLAEHYAAEALRLAGAARFRGELVLAQRLLGWLHDNWEERVISLPDIYQRSLNAIGDQATAKKYVGILEDHGWLVKIPQGAVVAGQQRRDAWRIIEDRT
jgi:Protein of unknown function (DUF3987)